MSLVLRSLLVVAAGIAAVLVGRALLGRIVGRNRVAGAQDTAAVVMEGMAALYGVLLAFLLSGAWDRLDQARATMTLETDALVDLVQIARFLPAPAGPRLTSAAEAYRENAVAEIVLLAEGGTAVAGDTIVGRLWRIIAGFEPRTPGQEQLQSRAFDAVDVLGTQRRIRLRQAARGLPSVLWLILAVGAAAVLGVAMLSSLGGRLSAVYLAMLAA
ncbi:MAG TPA: hypothetical protein VF188_12675, partial [Longimicrobiales bacterium]